MRQPYSRLPFKTYCGKTGAYIMDANDNIIANKIGMSFDAEYLCWAANNIKEVSEFLDKMQKLLYVDSKEDIDSELEDEVWKLEITKFVNKIQDGL